MSGDKQRGKRQIPIVCPGHTRPLAELQFTSITDAAEEAKEGEKGGGTPNRTFLISACHDKCPMIRDGTTGDWIGTWQGHKGAVWSCRLDSRAYLAATASGDFSAKVWDAITGKELMAFPHKHIVKTVDFAPDSRRLATGGHEGVLRIFDLAHPQSPPLMVPQSPDRKITITKLSWLDDRTVLAAGADGTIRFWDVGGSSDGGDGAAAPSLSQTLKVDAEVRDMELTRPTTGATGTRTMLTVAHGTTVSFFDLTDGPGRLLHAHKMPIHFREEGGATLHPDGTKFVAGGSDLWVRVFDFATGEELECHKGHHGPIRCLRYAPDGHTYATGSEDGTIRIWKTDP
jgi:serine-threonine kinase receptor-associated protein